MGGDLRALPRAPALARAMMRVIWQNLVWAFAYNVVLIPAAAFSLRNLAGAAPPSLRPHGGAAAHSASCRYEGSCARHSHPGT